jgi:hypothetical protein
LILFSVALLTMAFSASLAADAVAVPPVGPPIAVAEISAVETSAGERGAPFFGAHTQFEVTIAAPFKRMFAKRGGGAEGEGVLGYTDGKGEHREITVRISTGRGMRSTYCRFPPLTLALDADEIEETPFEGLGALYLTTHCRRGAQHEQYMHLEYLLYRMYGLVSDYSLNVRRLDVRYRDTEDDDSVVAAPAYVIEDVNVMAARSGMSRVTIKSHELADIDLPGLALFSLFQFMIGNTDWSALRARLPDPCCHNAHIVAHVDGAGVDGAKHFVVAFDFDQAGLINTEYATPSGLLPIRSVRQRLYRGFCVELPYVPDAIATLNRARPQVEALFRDDPLLTERARSQALDYLDESYRVINSEGELQDQIIGECRS